MTEPTKGPTGMCSCDPKFQPDRLACRLAIYASLRSQGCKCRCHEPEWATCTCSGDQNGGCHAMNCPKYTSVADEGTE